MIDTIVVGAGIFGQTIAAGLRKTGQKVTVVDNDNPMAGSKPSACLMRPSWFSFMGKDKYQPALNLLDEVFGIEDIQFDLRAPLITKKVGTATVHWCNPVKVLAGKTTLDTVTKFIRLDSYWEVVLKSGNQLESKNLVLATGVWTNKLVSIPNLSGKTGVAFVFPKAKLQTPFIQPYAPYKQIVAFNQDNGMWVGDGSAIKETNWSEERVKISAVRCSKALGSINKTSLQIKQGIRPYIKGLSDPCFLIRRKNDGLIVATGGAKNGMIASGYSASVIQQWLS